MNNINQMGMHGNLPANQVTGAASNMGGMHMSSAGGMMQQPGGMIQQQPGGMMQQQQAGMMQQQPGGIMQQQPGGMMQQQSGPMMQQQGQMMQQQQGPMMQQQGPMMQQQQQQGSMMQQPSPQQMQQGGAGPGTAPSMPQQPPPEKMDNISKVKTLMGSFRECVPNTLKSAAQVLHHNYSTDSYSQKGNVDVVPRFDKNLEEFFSLCDQMELHLRTAVTCIQQAQSAAHYLPLTVIPSRLDPTSAQETTLSYPSFLSTVRLQISYAKDIHDTLVAAAQNLAPAE
ncbi:hypothetical protein O0L34_g3065 [Tuta absoluta]|nr:hypothetical protein O0L34_g3065 [Tuta absoluta]